MTKPEKKHRNPYFDMLHEGSMRPAGATAVTWDVDIPAGVEFKEILKPGYWKQCSKRLSPLHMLVVYSQDMTYWARLLVLQNEPGIGAAVHVLEFVDLGEAMGKRLPSKSDEFEIKNKGFLKWCVVRKSDETIVSKGNVTQEDARRELQSHLKALTN